MSRSMRSRVAVLLGLAAAVAASGGSVPAAGSGPAVVVVGPWDEGTTVHEVQLANVLAEPSHGRLEARGDDVVFYPRASFWAVGIDSLVSQAGGRATTVVLAAGGHRYRLSQDFEAASQPWPRQGDGTRLSFLPAAALEGVRGGRLEPGPQPDFVEASVPFDPDNGTGQQGTGSGIKIRLPNGPGGGGLAESFTMFHRIAPQGGGESIVSLSARRASAANYVLLLEAHNQQPAYVDLPAGTHRLALTWRQTGAVNRIDARLQVNDLVVAERIGTASLNGQGPTPLLSALLHGFGGLDGTDDRWPLDLDELTVDMGPSAAGSELVLHSDFERTADPWQGAGMEGPQVSQAGALTGKGGVLLDLGHTADGAWQSTLPAAETAVGVRLSLKVSSGAQLPPQGLTILGGSAHDGPQHPMDVFKLALVEHDGDLQLEATTWTAAGVALARRIPLEEERPHVVELQWRAAGSAPDGLLRLWLDGDLAGEITQIAGTTKKLESLRLGVLGLGTGAGEVSVDDILAWRPARLAQPPAGEIVLP